MRFLSLRLGWVRGNSVAVETSALHERIHATVGDRTYRSIGQITGHNPETVRRYLQGLAPSVEFLAALSARFDVSAHWLMTGHGAMKYSDAKSHALKEANPAELLSAVAEALERLTDRVQRLEVFVQTLEAKVQARPAVAVGSQDEAMSDDHPDRCSPTVRASRVAQAIRDRRADTQ